MVRCTSPSVFSSGIILLPFMSTGALLRSTPLSGGCPEGVQGPPCRGLGCPQKPLFPLSPPTAANKKKEKGFFGDTPNPGRGRPPSALLPERRPPLKGALPSQFY